MSIQDIQQAFTSARRTASQVGSNTDLGVAEEMRANRLAKQSAASSSVSMAFTRPTDPMFYWASSNLPYDVGKPGELAKIRNFCRLLYLTHPTIGSVVDVYSTYPLVGMEMVCPKSKELAEFYNELFLDQLSYDEFLIDVGKQYWTVGEAFPLGSFNELLGTWEADELMLPEDVKVVRSPFLLEPRYEMRLPYAIRKIIVERRPEYEYRQIVAQYPELVAYATAGQWTVGEDPEDSDDPRGWIPISNMVMSHVKHKADAFNVRGVPLMMRAFRPLIQEEMLNAAQDAIASRLYTPLILAKIGASAQDLGTDTPWIPTAGDLDAFADDMNAALAADFRLITHHFAVNIENVFGRENMPDLSQDFDRLENKTLQAFGMSKTMLSGASSGETYAADALNRDLLTQLLTTFQKRMKRFVRHRAAVVAEAQGHYDFEMKGGRAVPIMEDVVETDPDTGDQRIVRQPKLLIPDMRIRSMNLNDEEKLHELLEGLRSTGVPISMRTRLVNVPVDLEEEREAVLKEQVDNAVAAVEAEKATYLALQKRKLPIPQELKDKFQPKVIRPGGDAGAEGEQQVLPSLGLMEPAPTTALAPTEEDIAAAVQQQAGGEGSGAAPIPQNRVLMAIENPTRPAESDEQRADMPKAASLHTIEGFDSYATKRIEGRVETIHFDFGDSGSEGQEMPVLGSFRVRHVGHRSESYFFKAVSEQGINGASDGDLDLSALES